MSKVIIGIHGLANKPPRDTLHDYWTRSIAEGLANVGAAGAAFDFKLVYWADRLYKNPLHEDVHFHFDALYNSEPYRPAAPGALQEYEEGWFDSIRATALDWGGSLLDVMRQKFHLDRLSTWLLGKLLKDLAFYYDDERAIDDGQGGTSRAREMLDSVLKQAIVEEAGKEILVIAHSMGSIIAYNTLRDIGRSHVGFDVAEFVTIGSPLGLPYVKGKIAEERTYDPKVRTPTCVSRSWRNYADRKDPVALDVHLRDDYRANARGVRVEDDLVLNDYRTEVAGGKVTPNHHKSYGYLRTPELSGQIRAFLAR